MYRFVKIALVLFFSISTASCASLINDGTEMVSYKSLLSRNLMNLNKLSVGMKKLQVLPGGWPGVCAGRPVFLRYSAS